MWGYKFIFMKIFKIFFAISIISIFNLSCNPEELSKEPNTVDIVIDLDKTASGDEENPIDDERDSSD